MKKLKYVGLFVVVYGLIQFSIIGITKPFESDFWFAMWGFFTAITLFPAMIGVHVLDKIVGRSAFASDIKLDMKSVLRNWFFSNIIFALILVFRMYRNQESFAWGQLWVVSVLYVLYLLFVFLFNRYRVVFLKKQNNHN